MAPKKGQAKVKNEIKNEPNIKEEGEEGGGSEWLDLCIPPHELRPEFSLMMGQCFNWRRISPDTHTHTHTHTHAKQEQGIDEQKVEEEVKVEMEEGGREWIGVLGQHVLGVRQTETSTLVRYVRGGEGEGGKEKKALRERMREYFQVDTPLVPLYAKWAQGDTRMKTVAEHIPGVRVVRQEPVECLFSFICSSNNNIPRITLMLDRLRQTYGEPLGDGFYTFPPLARLAGASEEELRGLGLGYRARFIRGTAVKLMELGGEEWLLALREKERKEAQEALTTFPGVGRKVADCVALFSLDQKGSIPVDVHVWRIACRDYDASLKGSKSLTPTIYENVGDIFRDKFGEHAGWAHSLLFAAELPNYRKRLPRQLQEEMEAFKKEESEEKALKREEKKKEKTKKEGEGEDEGEQKSKGEKAKKEAKIASTKASISRSSSSSRGKRKASQVVEEEEVEGEKKKESIRTTKKSRGGREEEGKQKAGQGKAK